jgi:UDP-N-acetyl-D-glucosamine dehydrogenase
MPAYVVEKVAHALNVDKKAVNGSRVLVLGVAYKRDIDDMRESPALDVMRLLEEQGADVCYHDPLIASFREGDRELHSVPLTKKEVETADCIVIITDHRGVDYQLLMDHAALVVDSRNVMSKYTPTRARIVSMAGGLAVGEQWPGSQTATMSGRSH